jgi:phosphoenolpyruvate carboxykinase (ATP)
VEGAHVHRNLSTPQLVEAAIARGEASLADNGALVALTGARTGRSPRDKFIVRDAVTSDTWIGARSTSPSIRQGLKPC